MMAGPRLSFTLIFAATAFFYAGGFLGVAALAAARRLPPA
jgi:hypothetical protein